jgi:DNA-binding cell septation regulator SpoVG
MFKILCYKILDKGSLKGFVDVEIQKWGDFQILGIKIFQNEKNRWVSMPAYKGEDKNKNGKDIYYPYVKFKEKDVSKIFEDKLLN